ncbi:zinc ribbon domain-containing protein [Halobacillus fulvus]|nr:zinc ribbon domain-containing protein [Halobacillus fulvus]
MTYCSQCGHHIQEGSRYCSQCGAPTMDEQPSSVHTKKRWTPYLIPCIAVIGCCIALLFLYHYEKETNEEVLNAKQQAEELAMNGDYAAAEKILVQAIDKRPDYKALTDNLTAVQSARLLQEEISRVSQVIENGKLKTAREQLGRVQQRIQNKEGQLYATLNPETNHLDSKITVLMINEELSRLKDVDELASRLNRLSGLNLNEASQVRKKVTEKMVSVSTERAEDALLNRQYTEAVIIVDQALQHVSNNESLLQLKDRIQQEQIAFEEQQQQRLEQAMVQAAEDELKNLNDALEMMEVEWKKDEFGDYKLSGKVKSVATQIISAVTATYEIVDKNGEVVKKDSSKVYPFYLNPGDEGTFEKVYYEMEDKEYSVRVTGMEWSVE